MLGGIIRGLGAMAYRITTLGLSKGPKLTRYYMYEHLSRYSAPRPKEARVLSISHSQRLAQLLGFTDEQITDVSYPEVNVLHLPFKNDEFDAVVSDMVLEHVEGNAQAAVDETFRVVKTGGIVLHTSVLLYPIHSAPGDCWRFTPDGLRLLGGKGGEVIDAGGWGNPYVVCMLAMGLRIRSVPHARWHPAHWIAVKNVKAWPISTWLLARKVS